MLGRYVDAPSQPHLAELKKEILRDKDSDMLKVWFRLPKRASFDYFMVFMILNLLSIINTLLVFVVVGSLCPSLFACLLFVCFFVLFDWLIVCLIVCVCACVKRNFLGNDVTDLPWCSRKHLFAIALAGDDVWFVNKQLPWAIYISYFCFNDMFRAWASSMHEHVRFMYFTCFL